MEIDFSVKIPLSDGAILGAELRRPSAEGRYPVLVSYYPYHKDGLVGAIYEYSNSYFVDHGYATLLVDLRGTGSSTGDPTHAMDPQEGRDGKELVEWAARQEWCDGNVGMWGVSYGGTTTFKTAALNPPSLKAAIPLLACWDFHRDFLCPGGCRNLLGCTAMWVPWMIAMDLMPPLLADSDGRWEEAWRARLDRVEPHLLRWIEHPDYDDYWASKAARVADTEVPLFLIGGWRDLYPEAMTRAYVEAKGAKRLLMGPWLHTVPDSSPFEAIEHLPEMLRWWDRWLKQEANGIDEEPAVRFFGQGGSGWLEAATWPPEGETRTEYLAADDALAPVKLGPLESTVYVGDPAVGTAAGLSDPFGLGVGLPLDQRDDERRSLTFTSDPVDNDTLIAGSPVATIEVAIEEGAAAHLVVKLADVAPDGRSSLITTGGRRVESTPSTSRTSHREQIAVRLSATGYLVKAGHRLRLAIATADFPRIWPTAATPTIRVYWGGAGGSRVELPVASPMSVHTKSLPAAEPDIERFRLRRSFQPRWRVEKDVAAGVTSVVSGQRMELGTPSAGGEFIVDHVGTASVVVDRPEDASAKGMTRLTARMTNGKAVEVVAETVVRHESVRATARVSVDGRSEFEKRWDHATTRPPASVTDRTEFTDPELSSDRRSPRASS